MSRMFAKQKEPTRIFEDNDATVSFANRGHGSRSLHWDVKCEYIFEQVVKHKVDVLPIDTKLQIADILTKALPISQHAELVALLLGSPLLF